MKHAAPHLHSSWRTSIWTRQGVIRLYRLNDSAMGRFGQKKGNECACPAPLKHYFLTHSISARRNCQLTFTSAALQSP